jgi:hypothetical protein
MKLLNQLERKLGRYAIHNLMRYIVALYALGLVVKPEVYHRFLSLDIDMLLKGQIWRIVTFLIQPVSLQNVLFLAIELYLYFMIGNALEQAWGAFRFNLYFISGIFFNILAVVIVYAITAAMPGVPATSLNLGLTYINRSMFFAFAALYPNMQFLIFFIIPVKVKYLAYIYGAFIAYEVFSYLFSGSLLQSSVGISIIVAMANFLIFFFSTRNYRSISPREFQRKAKFRKQMREGAGYNNVRPFPGSSNITRHKCAVCGRTERDDDQLEFRFCSKCEGNYEYCMDHLFTHEHVKK